ncbi:hypothetical protein HMPREF9148_01221 [Prevotella sp. F0091]|nr:hypothetical protein HMPREF9148_01221 [Prevotella sp. F0091]
MCSYSRLEEIKEMGEGQLCLFCFFSTLSIFFTAYSLLDA